ncbi:PaeR7I family type II restriction endonuclease [Rubinisphaera sp.]|uniref:PaeR7I family type II restriction endonuclease n=1 Tax=Rubinisphaera sp. TaxID=2024857 RepID=UPI0025D7E5B5|nr:PaeR7I family type II restriction endonuclease [Rubinisphaera sp.]|tara:strand:+ start:292 stop:1020 length:729 start_codon:yes stop_codon:yes gene_type:complete
MKNLDKRLAKAVKHFWLTRDSQSLNQGVKSGTRDAGLRTAVTGGKHLDGFAELCLDILIDAGLKKTEIYWKQKTELPGYFRAEKKWDLLAISNDQLIAVIEFKAQVGPSFGNNFNNRTEEAVGNATDLWAAYREGAIQPSQRPWLGFLFLLEDCPRSHSPVKIKAPHFKTFEEFQGASYAKRYEVMLTKLLRERLYDGTCLLLSKREDANKGLSNSPIQELSFNSFASSLSGHASGFAKIRE